MHYSARQRIVLKKILKLEVTNNNYTKLLDSQERVYRLIAFSVGKSN